MEPTDESNERSAKDVGSIPKTNVTVMTDNDPAPCHPFEVNITIGGDTWEYVQRAARHISQFLAERTPDKASACSGGGGGSFGVMVAVRDVTPEDFHRELQEWFERMRRTAN